MDRKCLDNWICVAGRILSPLFKAPLHAHSVALKCMLGSSLERKGVSVILIWSKFVRNNLFPKCCSLYAPSVLKPEAFDDFDDSIKLSFETKKDMCEDGVRDYIKIESHQPFIRSMDPCESGRSEIHIDAQLITCSYAWKFPQIYSLPLSGKNFCPLIPRTIPPNPLLLSLWCRSHISLLGIQQKRRKNFFHSLRKAVA